VFSVAPVSMSLLSRLDQHLLFDERLNAFLEVPSRRFFRQVIPRTQLAQNLWNARIFSDQLEYEGGRLIQGVIETGLKIHDDEVPVDFSESDFLIDFEHNQTPKGLCFLGRIRRSAMRRMTSLVYFDCAYLSTGVPTNTGTPVPEDSTVEPPP